MNSTAGDDGDGGGREGYPNKRARHSPPDRGGHGGGDDGDNASSEGGANKLAKSDAGSMGTSSSGKVGQSSSFRNVSACNRCRLRKNRCDQRLPKCASCEKASVKCVGYDPITKREIPRR